MNKIVREHYPVERLPEDLREGLTAGQTVRVVIEQGDGDRLERWMTVEDTLEMIRRYRAENPERVTTEEAVARIRELRDEWDD